MADWIPEVTKDPSATVLSIKSLMSHRPLCRFSDEKVRALDLVVCHAFGFPDLHPPYSGICSDLLPAHHKNSVSRNFQRVDRHWCGWYPL